MAEEKLERIYTVPLGDAYEYTRTKRTPRAVKILRQFMAKHMKSEVENVFLSNKLNAHLWEHSIQRPPRRVKVRVVKEEDQVKVYLPDEMTDQEKKAKLAAEAKEKAEKLKAEREAKAKAEKKEAPKESKPPVSKIDSPAVKEVEKKEEVKEPPKKEEAAPSEEAKKPAQEKK
jgi:large subunit ribosomal protein L31e